MKSIKGILGGIRQADQKFALFEEKDRIMIGVSGGKDSMVLAYALIQYQRFNFVNFEIVPAILDLGFPGFDATKIKEFFTNIGSELKVIDCSDVYKILKIQQKEAKHLPCSICSRMKKAAMNKAAKELGCNKVAFAHHADDAIETLFLNEIYGGRVATFQPKMHLERANIDFIRPLILVREDEIIACQKEEGIPSFLSHCPNDGVTMRASMKSLLKDIYKTYPTSKGNFLTMLSNYEREALFYDDIYLKIERKDLSFKPVISAQDALIEQKIRRQLSIENFSLELKRFIVFKRVKPIGVLSYLIKENKVVDIVDIALLKDSPKTRDVILGFIENSLFRQTNPITINVIDKTNEDICLKRGYKKTRRDGFSKYFE
jgi:tRNA 2-thiocytidine biosynthesis protein TtcA